MAAPEYLIKLKFGTEVDKKAFNEIQEAYQNLSKKQQAAFAKQYGASVQDMNKVFQKEARNNLREYEKAAIKTEQNITSARVKELREYINKRNQQLKALPGYLAGAAGTAGVLVANAAIANSFGLTEFDKNTLSSAMNLGVTGGAAGLAVAGPWGALGGALIGGVGGWVKSEFENSANAIKRSAELFAEASDVYSQTVNRGRQIASMAMGAGFESQGQFAVFQQAMRNAGIENLDFVYDLVRSIAVQPGMEQYGSRLIASRSDVALQSLYERFLESGMSARSFVMSSVAQGGLNQSDQRARALINLFELGGPQAMVNQVLASSQAYKAGFAVHASDLDTAIMDSNRKAVELSNKQFWQDMKETVALQAESIDVSDEIVEARDAAFQRSVLLMRESSTLLEGINETFRMYKEELSQIFEYITDATGGPSIGSQAQRDAFHREIMKLRLQSDRGARRALQLVDPGSVLDFGIIGGGSSMQTKVENAWDRTTKTRFENKPLSLTGF